MIRQTPRISSGGCRRPSRWRGRALAALSLLLLDCTSAALAAEDSRWPAIEASARGQTVYFNAWAGDEAINRYVGWVAQEVRREFGITLVHVKVTDIAETVTRVLAERAAGRRADGSAEIGRASCRERVCLAV